MPEKNLRRLRRKVKRWVDRSFNEPLGLLAQEYCRAPIVLYTGAGVSASPTETVAGKKFGLPTWMGLLQTLAPGTELSQDPWAAADEAVRACGTRSEFQRKLKELVESPDNYTRNYGQLTSTFLRGAPTLEAVAAFSGQLTGRIVGTKGSKTHFRSAANRRLHAVVTANYDCFLESAASSIYRKSPLQPVTALGSSAASATRIPVFHIHGYVPHPFYQQVERTPAVENLILTKDDYNSAWDSQDVLGTTMGPQVHYLRYFTVLFIGFSFADDYVNGLLKRVNSSYLSYTGRTHFALLPEKEADAKGRRFFTEIGVTPITYVDHSEIPYLLGTVYTAGLAADRILEGKEPTDPVVLPGLRVRNHLPTKTSYRFPPEAIWQIIRRARNESVGARFAAHLGETGPHPH